MSETVVTQATFNTGAIARLAPVWSSFYNNIQNEAILDAMHNEIKALIAYNHVPIPLNPPTKDTIPVSVSYIESIADAIYSEGDEFSDTSVLDGVKVKGNSNHTTLGTFIQDVCEGMKLRSSVVTYDGNGMAVLTGDDITQTPITRKDSIATGVLLAAIVYYGSGDDGDITVDDLPDFDYLVTLIGYDPLTFPAELIRHTNDANPSVTAPVINGTASFDINGYQPGTEYYYTFDFSDQAVIPFFENDAGVDIELTYDSGASNPLPIKNGFTVTIDNWVSETSPDLLYIVNEDTGGQITSLIIDGVAVIELVSFTDNTDYLYTYNPVVGEGSVEGYNLGDTGVTVTLPLSGPGASNPDTDAIGGGSDIVVIKVLNYPTNAIAPPAKLEVVPSAFIGSAPVSSFIDTATGEAAFASDVFAGPFNPWTINLEGYTPIEITYSGESYLEVVLPLSDEPAVTVTITNYPTGTIGSPETVTLTPVIVAGVGDPITVMVDNATGIALFATSAFEGHTDFFMNLEGEGTNQFTYDNSLAFDIELPLSTGYQGGIG